MLDSESSDSSKLAINGGAPVRETFLPYGKQKIDQDDIEAVCEVLRSDFLTTGPKVEEFEAKLASYIGCKHAVAVANGTAALHCAVYATGITTDDQVIVAALTFAASANAILYQGGTPVFADVDPETFLIDISSIRERFSPGKTKAIVAVDFAGVSVDLDPIMDFAADNNLFVVLDASHSLGTKYKGKMTGNKAHMTTFSFHPVKTATTGEGGAIVTNDDELHRKMALFRTHGITREFEFLENKNEGPWYYEQQILGYNYRLSDLHCALGISQLNKMEFFAAKRKEIAQFYDKYLNLPPFSDWLTTQRKPDWSDSVLHLFVICLKLEKFKVDKKEIFIALRAENIGVHSMYIPVYFHPYYRQAGYKKGLCSTAEKFYADTLCLPIFANMTISDAEDVLKALKKVLNQFCK